jgi:hypothetical protein
MSKEPKDKIKNIVDRLGISPKIQAKAMKHRVDTVYKKWYDNVADHNFSEKNYTDLKDYIQQEVKNI